MTPPCVVPTFRPYTVENLEFGGFYASSCESRVNPLQPLESTPVAARYGLRRTFVRELRAGEGIGGKSEPA